MRTLFLLFSYMASIEQRINFVIVLVQRALSDASLVRVTNRIACPRTRWLLLNRAGRLAIIVVRGTHHGVVTLSALS